MKTITKLGLAVTLLFLVSFFTQANAQSHDVKARNCKYYKKPPNPGSGAEVTDFSVCKVCSEKKKKEDDAKRAEDKRRADALVAKTKADNERKAKEAAEKQRLQNEKNKPVNATLVMPKNTDAPKKQAEPDKGDLSNWVNPGEYIATFYKGSKYSIKQVAINSRPHSQMPCDLGSEIISTAIVNRKLETIIAPANETIAYKVIQPTPFAFEYSYANTSLSNACSAKIFNIETKEIIAELSVNDPYERDGYRGRIIGGHLIQVQHIDLNHKYEANRKFNERIMKIHEKEKFDVVYLPEGNDGYFFWTNGKYRKVTKEEREYILNNK